MVRTTLGTTLNAEVSVESSESVNFINEDFTGTLPSGASETKIIRAPAGTVLEIFRVRLIADPITGATTGGHKFDVLSESRFIGVLSISSNGTDFLRYNRSEVRTASTGSLPTDPAAQAIVFDGLRIDDKNGLQVKYQNNTDADQTNVRPLRIWARQIEVSSV